MTSDPVKTTIDTYDAIAPEYAQKTRLRFDIPELEMFRQALPAKGSILDIGCGSGRDAAWFAARSFEVTGIDLSKELLTQARQSFPHLRFLYMSMTGLTFDSQSFDGVWVNASLFHLPKSQISQALQGFYRILKPSGSLFIRVKKGEGEAMVKQAMSSDQPRFYAYFSIDELKQYVASSRFEIIHSYIYNRRDRNPESRDLFWIVVVARKIS